MDGDPLKRLEPGGALEALARLSSPDTPDLLPGRRLGPYEIVEFTAQGGMSRVYRARRSDGGFDRDVAIKVSAESAVSPALRDRFLREQQVLAGLSHPGISQLFDVDVTTEGWPYIVMEWVDGQPIDDYCRSHGLSRLERLAQLLMVVDAVAYAHARLVVHRDIKASNVLVTAEGQAKLLDFGIAKLIETDATSPTGLGPMTPRYASPEQLLGRPITVASDIYQLGLLMHDVLLDEPLVADGDFATAIQLAAEGGSRRLDAAARRRLPAELVQIIEHCLRHGPEERYGSALELADDLRAWRDGYPVRAVGQSAGYRAGKFLRRNRVAAGLVGLAAVTLVTGTLAYTRSLAEARALAEAERDTARRQTELAERRQQETAQVVNYLTELFTAADPLQGDGLSITAGELLERGVAQIREAFDDQPNVRARLLNTLGDVYTDVGRLQEAQPLLEEALALQQGDPEADSRALAETHYNLGLLYNLLSDLPKSREHLLASEARYATLEPSPDHGTVLQQLGVNAYLLGKPEQGVEYLEQAIDVLTQTVGPDDWRTHISVGNLGTMYRYLGDYETAMSYYDRSLPGMAATLGDDHIDYGMALSMVGQLDVLLGNLERASERMTEGARIMRLHLPEDDYRLATPYSGLAVVYRDLGRFEESLTYARRNSDIVVASRGEQHPHVVQALINVARAETEAGDLQAARSTFERLYELMPQVSDLPPELPVSVDRAYGDLLLRSNEPALAARHLDSALAGADALGEPGRWERARTLVLQARLPGSSAAESLNRLEEALRLALATHEPDSLAVATVRLHLAENHQRSGRREAAEAALAQALPILEDGLPVGHPHRGKARELLAALASAEAG